MSEIRTPSDSRIPSEAEVTALAAEYYEVVQDHIHKDRDCHWRIVERWSYGEHAGWFVEHDGYLYELAGGEYDEQGPFPSREAALIGLRDLLRDAIGDVRSWDDG
jgi:hypothetical protein